MSGSVPRARRDRGAVFPLVGLLLPILILMTSFAVDLGQQRAARRQAQADADVIALDMVRLIEPGLTEGDIEGDPDYGAYWRASARRNGVDVSSCATTPTAPCPVEIEFGTWSPQSGFIGILSDALPGPTAVKVVVHDEADFLFSFTHDKGEVTREAIAMQSDTEIGAFSIGGSLARLRTGDSALLNPVLSGLLNSPVNLGALDYQGLATANVSLLDLIEAHPTAGSVDELLASELTMAEWQVLVADALTNRGMAAQANLLRTLPVNIPSPARIPVGELLDLSSGEGEALNADLNAFDLILAGAQVSNGSNFVDLDLGIPGVASAQLKITEPPKIAIGPAATDQFGNWITQAHSANLRIDLELKPELLNLNLNVAGLASAKITLAQVPISITGAGASGYLTDIDCGPDPDVLDVLTVPRPLQAMITNGATVVGLDVKLLFGLVTIPVSVVADMEGPATNKELPSTTLQDIPVGSTRSTGARNLQLGNLLTVSNIDVNAVGLSLSLLDGIGAAVLGVLNPALNSIDNALDPVFELLGARIAESDVAALSARCAGTGVRLVG